MFRCIYSSIVKYAQLVPELPSFNLKELQFGSEEPFQGFED